MAKIDIETLEDFIIQIVKDNLSAKVTEINNDKNDGILIDNIIDADYFNTFEDRVNNINNFIYYGYNDIQTLGIGPATAQTFSIFIIVFLNNMNPENFSENRKKVFRYTRAIQEIIQRNAMDIPICKQITVSGILPQDFQLNEESPLYKVGGVTIDGVYT